MNNTSKVTPLPPPEQRQASECMPEAVQFSEDALAAEFTKRHGDEMRYVAKWGKWLRWDGVQWAFEETHLAFDYARTICREIAQTANKPKERLQLTSSKTVAAVERLAKADRQHAATVDQWDTDPWLLNTPAGVVDLRTGNVHEHRRDDYITKTTAVSPGGDCPRWMGFLEQITNGDRDLQGFLKQVAGYALTGRTSEHALFFLYGTGANGKSVFLNTLAGIWSAHHETAPVDTFVASHGERHPTDLAMLRGARLVTAIETEEGKRWAEAKIKSLTGGDPIPARFMRQDFFTYTPQFKLMIAGNHKPALRNVDEAMRRRIHMIPFTVTIPEEERDEQLTDKLREEWPGILAWAVEGAVEWATNGLQPPDSVRQATEDYLVDQDHFAQWIEERCATGPSYSEAPADLYRNYKAWCEINGEAALGSRSFGDKLEEKGYPRERTKAKRLHRGIRLELQDDGGLPYGHD